MRLNTGILFQLLLKVRAPDLILDVGSMDGTHARRFRALVPSARVVAFEANPERARAMQDDRRNRDAHVEVMHRLAWSRDGWETFHLEEPSEGVTDPAALGLSSTRKRLEAFRITHRRRTVRVPAIRVDGFVMDQATVAGSIALWIDVEGAAYDVLVGIEGIKERVTFIHVEVEDREIWHGQKLEPDVRRLLERWGFREVACGASPIQHDAVYINDRTRVASPILVRTAVGVGAVLSVVARWPLAARVLKALGPLAPTWHR